MNNTVYFNPEWMEALSSLKEESRNMIISAIITYQVTGEMPTLSAGKAIFMLLKLEVDRRNRRLADAREKRLKKKNSDSPSQEKSEPEVVAPESATPTPEPAAQARESTAPTPESTAEVKSSVVTQSSSEVPIVHVKRIDVKNMKPGVTYLIDEHSAPDEGLEK